MSMTNTVSALTQCHTRVGRRWRYAIRRGGAAGVSTSIGSSMIGWSSIGDQELSSGKATRQRLLLQPRHNHIGNARASAAVAEREARDAHRGKLGRVVKKSPCFGHDPVAVGADENGCAANQSLRAFGLFA